MNTFHLPHDGGFFSKRVTVFIAVVGFHVLVAGLFISGFDGSRRAQSVIPIPTVPAPNAGLSAI